MLGMTGYGKAMCRETGIFVEMKSVNHRFCETKIYLPRGLGFLEIKVSQFIKERAARGYFTVSVGGGVEQLAEPEIRLSQKTLEAYLKAAEQIAAEIEAKTGVKPNPPSVDTLLRLEGIVENIAEPPEEESWNKLKPLFEDAMNSLIAMRKTEGETIKKEFLDYIQSAEKMIAQIEEETPSATEAIQKRIEANLKKAASNMQIDEARLAQEIAYIVERSDITEEINRFKAHLLQFKKLVEAKESAPIGRKLDFILQELNREANTMASKTQGVSSSLVVVELKSELEKAREQAQNIE